MKIFNRFTGDLILETKGANLEGANLEDANLEEYKARKASGDWLSVSNFPVFNIDNNVTVEFE